MDAKRQMHFGHIKQPAYAIGTSDGRHRDALRTPCQPPRGGEYLDSAHHRIKIVSRFTHPHEHHVGQTFRLFDRQYLVNYLSCRQIAVKTLSAGHAEGAVHAASGLRADTQRAAVAVGDHHSLYITVARSTEQIFHSPVGRRHPLHRLLASGTVGLSKCSARTLRKIGHVVDLRDPFLIQPVGHLACGISRHSAACGHGFQLGEIHADERCHIFHDAKISKKSFIAV